MTDDDDGDGMTEAEEAVAGTDALDSNSVLRVVAANPPGEPGGFRVQVYGITNHFYTLQSSTNLDTWTNEDGGETANVSGMDALLYLVDSNAMSGGKFYRIRAGD